MTDEQAHTPAPPPDDKVLGLLGNKKAPAMHIPGAGNLGIALLIVALGMLFAASLVSYLVVRYHMHLGPGAEIHLPPGLWVSTAILLISSGTIHWALAAVRRDQEKMLRLALAVTFALGIAFLIMQTANWLDLAAAMHRSLAAIHAQADVLLPGGAIIPADRSLVQHHDLLVLFYVFTILHGLHVLGGLIPLAVVTLRAFSGRYSRNYHPGVRYSVMYWHFLDIVWLLIFAVLELTF